jgi:diguanylate cyclase (GGDEF)-like protein
MGERILVVDNEPDVRLIIKQAVQNEGHEAIEVGSGEAALEACRTEPFPLIITEVLMDGMSGIDLLNEIRLINEDVLVVFMTSQASLEMATAALRAGAYDLLPKPLENRSTISNVISRAVDKLNLVRRNSSLMAQLRKNMEELELMNRNLEQLANHDGLTGLLNNRCFRESLDLEMARARRYNHPFSLVFMDLDHFKQYNDTQGHPAGDRLLKDLARLLKTHSRAVTVLARYGGEEFVALAPETPKDGALTYAERLRSTVEKHRFEGCESQPFGKVTLSAGVATFPEDGEEAATLIERADKALYEAKKGGRNRVVSYAGVCTV